MSYVIYNTKTKELFPSLRRTTYTFERDAKSVKTKKKLGAEWKVAPYADWVADDHMVEVISLMNGKPVQIRASSVGCRASDPSMEGYWTM